MLDTRSCAQDISARSMGHLLANIAQRFGDNEDGFAMFIEFSIEHALQSPAMPDPEAAPKILQIFEQTAIAAATRPQTAPHMKDQS